MVPEVEVVAVAAWRSATKPVPISPILTVLTGPSPRSEEGRNAPPLDTEAVSVDSIADGTGNASPRIRG
jgi:hypothetical protein